jgi:hypothetical protein
MKEKVAVTIVEFLEARIAEDEARASSGWARLGDTRWETTNEGQDFLTPSAVLAECAAKRAIIEAFDSECPDLDPYVGVSVISMLAAVYKAHPDYQKEWDTQ